MGQRMNDIDPMQYRGRKRTIQMKRRWSIKYKQSMLREREKEI